MSTKREPLAETRTPEALDLPHPYLLFLGDTTEAGYAKTAFGLRDWAADRCVGEWSCEGATVTTGLPRLSPKEARARGARALLIGVANVGGMIAESWMPSLMDALDSGLDIISGMHTKLNDTPQLKSAAERRGRRLIDVRTPPRQYPDINGPQTHRPTSAHRGYRLRARQEIYRPGARAGVYRSRRGCRFSGDRPDRHHDFRPRNSDGCGGGGFRGGRCGNAHVRTRLHGIGM